MTLIRSIHLHLKVLATSTYVNAHLSGSVLSMSTEAVRLTSNSVFKEIAARSGDNWLERATERFLDALPRNPFLLEAIEDLRGVSGMVHRATEMLNQYNEAFPPESSSDEKDFSQFIKRHDGYDFEDMLCNFAHLSTFDLNLMFLAESERLSDGAELIKNIREQTRQIYILLRALEEMASGEGNRPPSDHWLADLAESSVPALMRMDNWKFLTENFFPVLQTDRFQHIVGQVDQADAVAEAQKLLAEMNALPLYRQAIYRKQIRKSWPGFLSIKNQSAYSFRELIMRTATAWNLFNNPLMMKIRGNDRAHIQQMEKFAFDILVLLKAALLTINGREGKSET